MIPCVNSDGTITKNLLLNSFSDGDPRFVKHGASPYLDASDYPSNYLTVPDSPYASDIYWDFQNTTLTGAGAIFSVKLQLNGTCLSGNGEIYTRINFVDTSTESAITLSSWAFQEGSNKSSLWREEVNVAAFQLLKRNRGDIVLDCARLYVSNGTDNEYLYVENYVGASKAKIQFKKWGSSPWLDFQDYPLNYISGDPDSAGSGVFAPNSTVYVVDYWHSFEHASLESITSVVLKIYAYTETEGTRVRIMRNTTAEETENYFNLQASVWKTYNVTFSTIDTVAKLNSLKIAIRTAWYPVYIDQIYLEVTGTYTRTSVISSLISEAANTLTYISVVGILLDIFFLSLIIGSKNQKKSWQIVEFVIVLVICVSTLMVARVIIIALGG